MTVGWPRTLHDLPRAVLGFHVWVASNREPAASPDDRLAVLELESAARRLLDRYAYCYDAGDLEGLMEVYADDCVVVNRHGTFVGADAIRANYARAIGERETSFHHLSNVEVAASRDLSEAWATAYVHALSVRDGVAGGTMASLVFHLRRERDSWKICEARIVQSNKHSFGPPQQRRAVEPTAPTRPETVADMVDA